MNKIRTKSYKPRQPLEPIQNINGVFCRNGMAIGYIFTFKHGCYAPDGLVPNITEDQAKQHNMQLSDFEIKMLDRAEIGDRGTLYLKGQTVTTWVGSLVSDKVRTTGSSVEFQYKGKTFYGRLGKSEMFNFKRAK